MLRWFSYRPYTYAEIAAKYLPRIRYEVPTDPYLILYANQPIGFIQTYRISDHPAYNQYVQADEHTAGLDLFIGEEEYLHRGLGSSILREFLQQVVFAQDWAESCVVGPEPDNQIAIRAYQKIGGHPHSSTVRTPWLPAEAGDLNPIFSSLNAQPKLGLRSGSSTSGP